MELDRPSMYDMPSDISDDESFIILEENQSDPEENLEIKPSEIATDAVDEAKLLVDAECERLADSLVAAVERRYMADSLKCSSILPTDDVPAQIEDIIAENKQFKEIIAHNNDNLKTMQEQLTNVSKWQLEVQKAFQAYQDKFLNAKATIATLQLKNEELQEHCNELESTAAKRNTENNIDLGVQTVDFEANLNNELQMKVWEKEAQLEKLRNDLDKSEARCNLIEEELIRLRGKVIYNVSIDETREECRQKQEQLLNSQIIITELREQLKMINVTLTFRTQQLDSALKKKKATQQIEKELKECKLQFEDYKKTKESVIEAMSCDREELLRQILQLQDRIYALEMSNENTQSVNHQPSAPSAGAPSESTSPKPHKGIFVCPKCNFKFTTYQKVQNHIFRCLNLDESLP